MKRIGYESPIVELVLFAVEDIVRTSPNDDGAINAGNSSITNGWWEQD